MNFFEELQARGIVYQSTDPSLSSRLERSKKERPGQGLRLYAGFDPTADSLHVGSLFPLLSLRRFQREGHTPIALVGGATGMIGDPSGKTQQRSMLDKDQLAKNLAGIRRVIERFLDFTGPNAARVVDNFSWFEGFTFIDFLRDVGKHFTVNHMIAKESVRSRLEDRAHGLSYTEFSYMLLQAYDFYHLHRNENVELQIGGSDQWGNITAGTDLIRRMKFIESGAASEDEAGECPAYGMTQPLVTKQDGTKFGKTESGTVWLDADKTSPYEFYQFLMQTTDADVIKLLKYFSFRPFEELAELEKQTTEAPEKRAAQTALAREVTALVHGADELAVVEKATRALFGGEDLRSIPARMLPEILKGAPLLKKDKSSAAAGVRFLDLVVESGLCASNGAAKKEVSSGGLYLNNERVSDLGKTVASSDLLHGRYCLLRKGKKNYVLVRFE